MGGGDRRYEMNSTGSGYCPMPNFCENGDGPLGFIKGWNFFDTLNDYQKLRKHSVLWS
jgi:hypothetical protein